MKKLDTVLQHILHSQETIYQLIRYTFVGGVAFVVDYGLLFCLTEFAGLHYLWSAAVAFVAGLAVNYTLSLLLVFTTHRLQNAWIEFAIFALIGVVGLGLNEGIIYVVADILGAHYMLAKIVSTILVFFWNFFARKLTLFQK